MPINILQNKKRIFLIILCVAGFAFIRGNEKNIFYDPFLTYFRNDYLKFPWPEFNLFKLSKSLTIRYTLNSILSVLILYLLFKDIKLIKFTSILYVLLYLILIVLFLTILILGSEEQNFILFYVRRFLMHPLFILLFIPAFYFQKIKSI